MFELLWCLCMYPWSNDYSRYDGMDPNIRVPTVRRVRAPATTSYLARHRVPPPLEALALVVLIW
jgi:hypothetical protein